MERGKNNTKAENITNVTLFLYLNRYSSLVVDKATIEAKIDYDTKEYRQMKKEYKNDIKKIKTIDELPIKWSKYFEEAEEEVIRNREEYFTRKRAKKLSQVISN